MGKKRKGAPKDGLANDGTQSNIGNPRMRIRTFEDVADSDDEFHVNSDKILLDEEPDAKRRRKWQEQEEFLQPSDEEVLAYSSPEESGDEVDDAIEANQIDGSDSENGAGREDDEDEEGAAWGMSKGNMYGADAIETEEQALEEEAEALRLQKKQLQAMSAADYGFDEAEWQEGGTSDGHQDLNGSRAVVTEVLPQLQISEDATSAERLKLLGTRYPEFEHLRKELLEMKQTKRYLEARVDAAYQSDPSAPPTSSTKLRAATTYAGALAMYFALLTSPASTQQANAMAMPANELRAHPIMDSLLRCRELWQKVEGMPIFDAYESKKQELSPHKSDLKVAHQASEERATKSKRSRAQRHSDSLRVAQDARDAERLQRTEADLADLDALIAPESLKRLKHKTTERDQVTSGFAHGEEAPLTAQELAEKSKTKKSLRFYTSQIAQKANKRGTAGRNAGGDDDIPYRERLKDRQARLIAEAERRGRKPAQAGEELGGDSDEEDRRQAKALREETTGGGGDDDEDYYDLVAARNARKKSDKAAFAEAQKEAALRGGQVVQAETIGADGKRKISYAIEKNKGLTPHRKKDVRNPRVKKRKKYDEKKKKLSSIKPVYKGGEGRGGYGGELTGIKKGLIKSTKL